MEPQPRPPRPRGRPRNSAIDRALSQAALQEFIENGYRNMSMESIAARAGTTKVTLYRRWNSKLAVAADVLRLMSHTTPTEDHGSLEADVRALVHGSVGSSDARSSAMVLMRTMGEISGDPELLALYRTHLLGPRLEELRALVERARARDELRAGLETDIACAMIAGPLFLYYLAVLAQADLELAGNPAEQIVRAVLRALAK